MSIDGAIQDGLRLILGIKITSIDALTALTPFTMTPPTLEELVKQGDVDAITTLLNRALQSRGITAKAAIKNAGLHVVVEAVDTPPQQESVAIVRDAIASFPLELVGTVTVYGRQPDDDIPDWHQTFVLGTTSSSLANSNPQTKESFSFAKMVGSISDAIGNTTSQTGRRIVETASGVGEVVSNTTSTTGKVLVETATEVGKVVTGTVLNTGKAVVETASGVGGAIAGMGGVIGTNASKAGQSAFQTAVGVGGTAAKQTYQLLNQIAEFVAGVPILRKVVDQVDLVKAEATVKKLQQKHLNETPRQIAHRIMVEKAIYAGGTGLVTSLVPGAAAALFAVDLTATSALQAEMVYQIAAAYGLKLNDPARRGEVLTIFGLALGGNQAMKAGLELLQNTPVAGAVIGASTNAVMLYTVGYAACRFYEAKLDSQAVGETLVASQAASEDYLQKAIAQQIVMDQILVHIILAGNPDKSWEDLLPELEALNISPASLSVIERHIQSPLPLEELLAQLDRDFALPLLAQCQRVILRDGVATSAESQAIEAIAQNFEVDLNALNYKS